VALFLRPDARIAGGTHRLLDIGGGIAAVVMTIMAIGATVSHMVTLYRQETR
jgi:uncharacterized membrane protein